MLSALEHIPARIRQHRIFDDSTLKLKTISPEEMKGIREAILPVIASQGNIKESVSDYVDSIATSLKEDNRENVKWTDSDKTFKRFKERLTALFSIESLQLVAKAHDVLLEHARTFSRARIISDIRPVFGDKVEEPPIAAVIVHMLNIAYVDSGKRKEFVVALDTKDIQLLMDALKRAQDKTESLQSVIASTNMTYIPVV
ncbi:MAG TPA: hypothetical protein VGB73_04700 [Pyrinomonadaceae bacterium]